MKNKYYGWEFKPALTAAIHKMASDLGMSKVDVTFRSDIPTAAINRQGRIFIQNIKDDAVLNRSDLEQFTGYALHELLHWKYTNFGVMEQSNIKYLIQLHNGIEDAWIENRAIANKLTGNVAQLLGSLIDRMAAEGLREVTDWADPRQYPFALAVYARKHSTIKVPLADGLQPLFDHACLRLNNCQSTADTWAIAEWLFNELCKFQPLSRQQILSPLPTLIPTLRTANSHKRAAIRMALQRARSPLQAPIKRAARVMPHPTIKTLLWARPSRQSNRSRKTKKAKQSK